MSTFHEIRSWGRGKVAITETGVTRSRLWRSRHLAWSEIRDYRVIGNTRERLLYELGEDDFFTDAPDSDRRAHFRLRLLGDAMRIEFGWPIPGAPTAMAYVLGRVAKPMVENALAVFARDAHWRAGDLSLAPHGLQWRAKEVVPVERVEWVEIFGSHPLSIRIMLHEKVIPYASARTSDIPNLLGVLALCRSMGLKIVGERWLAPILVESQRPSP